MQEDNKTLDDDCTPDPERPGFSVGIGTITALMGRTDTRDAAARGYIHIVPAQWLDLERMGALEDQFQALGIRYGKNDVYPAFKSKEKLDAALLAVHDSGWNERWAIQNYLVAEGLIEKPEEDQ